jgi:hypothetical protein
MRGGMAVERRLSRGGREPIIGVSSVTRMRAASVSNKDNERAAAAY